MTKIIGRVLSISLLLFIGGLILKAENEKKSDALQSIEHFDIKLIEAKGDYYQCGYQIGAATKTSIRRYLAEAAAEYQWKEYQQLLHEIHKTCKEYYPNYVRELEGIADGAGVNYWHLLFLNNPEIVERKNGCTSIAGVEKNRLFVVHNEDGVSQEQTQYSFLVHYILPDVSFYAFMYAGELPGSAYGWNSYGIYTVVDYVEPMYVELKQRVSRFFVARSLLESKNIAEGISRLKSSRNASGYHYYLGNKNHIFSIEQLRDKISIKEVKGIDIHTNHYLDPDFAQQSYSDKHSRLRYHQAHKLIRQGNDALQILTDRTHAPYSIYTIFDEMLYTLSTVRFLPQEHKVEVYEPGSLRKIKAFKF